MIPIRKKPEPDYLVTLREKAVADALSPYDAYHLLSGEQRADLRERLRHEQGCLCAYCMCRIPREDLDPAIQSRGVTIEHRIPVNPIDGKDVGQGLDYQNMLAVCNGNKSRHGTRTSDMLTCDVHKGNQEFRKVNPCDPETLKSITYTMDGKIDATDPDVAYDLNQILNLNESRSPLIAERKSALFALLDEMTTVSESDLSKFCQSRLEFFENQPSPKTPFVGILIWYLKRFLGC